MSENLHRHLSKKYLLWALSMPKPDRGHMIRPSCQVTSWLILVIDVPFKKFCIEFNARFKTKEQRRCRGCGLKLQLAYQWADSRRWSQPNPPGSGWAEGLQGGWCWSWRSPGMSSLRWVRSCGWLASEHPGTKTERCAAWARKEKSGLVLIFRHLQLFLNVGVLLTF